MVLLVWASTGGLPEVWKRGGSASALQSPVQPVHRPAAGAVVHEPAGGGGRALRPIQQLAFGDQPGIALRYAGADSGPQTANAGVGSVDGYRHQHQQAAVRRALARVWQKG